MFHRAVAFLLAFVVLWSGFAAQDAAPSAALATLEHAGAEAAGDASQRTHGGAGEHPAELQPSQALAEGATDLPALITDLDGGLLPALASVRPPRYAQALRLPPYLDGLRRPPRALRAAA